MFFENPEYRNVKISPDGKHLSYLAPLDGVRNLWVAPVDAPGDAQPVTRATDRDIGWDFRWAYTDRHLLFFRDHDGDENWRAASVDLRGRDDRAADAGARRARVRPGDGP